MVSVRVPGFLPSARGFHFANRWPHIPVYDLRLGDLAKLSIGDAANGLCGGMSFAVADLFIAGLSRPGQTGTPGSEDPHYRYIVDRQIDSFDGIAVPLRFYSLMRRRRPEREPLWASWLATIGVDRHSRGYVMVREEWPRVRAELDSGRVAMVGLVRVIDDNPFSLNHNHQVLAYGYDLDGDQATVRIYDPNWPDDDDVTLRVTIGDPRVGISAAYSKADGPVVCFFRAPYVPHDPAPWR